VPANEFSGPAFHPSIHGVPAPHITLYLKGSRTAGNFVNCDYKSNHEDVVLTTTLDCKNAHKADTLHSYQCEP